MNLQLSFPWAEVSSKPTLRDVGGTKILEFQVNDHGHDLTFRTFGKYAETASKWLRKGHQISLTAHPGSDGNTFVLDRMCKYRIQRNRISRRLSRFKDRVLSRLDDARLLAANTLVGRIPVEPGLVDMVLEWWEENKYEEYPMGDGEWDNLYNEEPDFVTEARNIKEEVKEDD